QCGWPHVCPFHHHWRSPRAYHHIPPKGTCLAPGGNTEEDQAEKDLIGSHQSHLMPVLAIPGVQTPRSLALPFLIWATAADQEPKKSAFWGKGSHLHLHWTTKTH